MAAQAKKTSSSSSSSSSGSSSAGEFVCPECGRTFSRAAALGSHRRRALTASSAPSAPHVRAAAAHAARAAPARARAARARAAQAALVAPPARARADRSRRPRPARAASAQAARPARPVARERPPRHGRRRRTARQQPAAARAASIATRCWQACFPTGCRPSKRCFAWPTGGSTTPNGSHGCAETATTRPASARPSGRLRLQLLPDAPPLRSRRSSPPVWPPLRSRTPTAGPATAVCALPASTIGRTHSAHAFPIVSGCCRAALPGLALTGS